MPSQYADDVLDGGCKIEAGSITVGGGVSGSVVLTTAKEEPELSSFCLVRPS